MKKIFLISSAVLFLGIASSSYAAALINSETTPGALPGLYVGVGGGVGVMFTTGPNATDKSEYAQHWDESGKYGFSGRGFLGYLWAIPNMRALKLGVETGYEFYPKRKYRLGAPVDSNRAQWDYKMQNIDVLGVAKYNFNDSGFNILLKGGMAYVMQERSITEDVRFMAPLRFGGVGSITRKQWKPKVAAGVGYDINQNVGISLLYSVIIAGKRKAMGDPDIVTSNNVLFNIAYHFGGLDKRVL